MSGSSSRFPGRAEPAMPMPGSYDPYDEPTTMVPSTEPPPFAHQGSAGAHVPPAQEPASDLYVPARGSDRGRKMKVMAPVVPPGSVTGRSLTLVIAIMCFLACLTAGAVWMIKESSDAWLNDISSEVTVQVTPQENGDTDKAVADVVSYLEKQRGITNVRALDLSESADLLQPWLGSGDALKSLPVPRLIAVEVDRTQPPDFTEVGQALGRDFKGVSLDDHRRWQQQIRAVTRSLALGGLAILALVAAATTAIIVSATRSAMASNREIVEVLHFVGATDKFISREFEKHFLRLGIKAGIVGATCAMVVFMCMPWLTELLGGGPVGAVEMQRLVGTGSLDALGYLILGLVVIIIAGLCTGTSRVGVHRILNGKH